MLLALGKDITSPAGGRRRRVTLPAHLFGMGIEVDA